MGMHVARSNFVGKGRVLSSIARNSSCRGVWLHRMVQGIFATITVTSFILIVIMAVKNPNPSPVLRPTAPPRCQILGCRVTCKEAPYFEQHEDDIIFTVTEAEAKCTRIVLELFSPNFVNNTLPENWLSRMRSNVHQLSIIRGNLKHIPSGAFMSQFTGYIKILALHELQIKTWESTSLVGLSSLRTFNIINCRLESVYENALRAVDDTLETLTITESGVWDPVYFTGSRGIVKLTIVDFSYNDFDEILGRMSFVGLEVTKILYLNSCRIRAIGAGAFDYLHNIEVLYLNNNMLFTITPGLFNTIIGLENPRPRINLQDNFWLCDCSAEDLRQLIRKDLLLVDATCTYPEEMYSTTFTQFEMLCSNDTTDPPYGLTNLLNLSRSHSYPFIPEAVYVNGSYCSDKMGSNLIRVISPVPKHKCHSKIIRHINTATLEHITNRIQETLEGHHNVSQWLRFSYFLKTDTYSVVQIGAFEKEHEYGLVWYQSSCPHELYCLDVIPTSLRVYNIDLNASYTFCPLSLDNVRVENESCVRYDFSTDGKEYVLYTRSSGLRIILVIAAMFICSCIGAVTVYGLIRQRPTLLKGSKRILFVKHKNVDALVLPPKVPLRNDLKTDAINFKDKDIFTLSTGHKSKAVNLNRIKSVRSNKSGTPSYISAMQPTDDQLAEWRIRRHFNNDLTDNSMKSELSTLSWICADSYYYSLEGSERTYESLK